jgi:tetratricopeptide (TPR) repeat protein
MLTARLSKKHLLAALLLIFLLSCQQSKEEKAFKIFNEGVSLSLNAYEESNKGNQEKANELNNEAIEKFKETLKIDSGHKAVRGALAHSLYLNKNYDEAINWFKKANAIEEPSAANYRELGLSEINMGMVKEGEKDILNAFKLDRSKEIKDITVLDLFDIGKLAFAYGEGYEQEGKKEQGLNYKQFSIEVLNLALKMDPSQSEISDAINIYKKKLNHKS